MSLGIWQIVIIAVVVLLLFGRGKISDLMGDVAKGIKSFKHGLKDDDAPTAPPPPPPSQVEHTPAPRTEAPAEMPDRKSV